MIDIILFVKFLRYRILAFDGKEFSWLDMDNMNWPAVLVTSITMIRENRRPIAEVR